jgi:hypothetical protein
VVAARLVAEMPAAVAQQALPGLEDHPQQIASDSQRGEASIGFSPLCFFALLITS